MTEQQITLEALNIDPKIYFLGTDEEQEKAEAKETARAAELEKIIFSEGFRAMEYINEYGQRRILHHSTRPGILFQMSYIGPDGVAAMHENYIQTGDPGEYVSIESRSKL